MKKFLVLVLFFMLSTIASFADTNRALPSQIGKVVSILYDDKIQTPSQPNSERQIVQVKILTGLYKGNVILVDNMITGNPAYDIQLHKGQKVILHAETSVSEVSSINDISYYISDQKRDNALWFIAGVFCLLLILVGKKKGACSLLSIVLTVGLIFTVLVPMILSGISPILSATIVGILSTVITIYLVAGFNPKSTSAIIGTVSSLVLAGGLAIFTINYAKLTGFAGEESLFLYSSNPTLDFRGLLAASIIIAALGALMDTAVSISSTINEIHETNQELGVGTLFKSGMNVGRDVIGTMSNTLILVYLGSSLPLVLLSQNIDLQKFFNLNQVATEVSSALIGSIAILACVPFTAIIAAILIKNKKDEVKFNFKD